ncbi:MAG TPA: acyltransferase, partial [Bacteroidales bacterium]|nr:acyltransferase [Bacteroidales bacterium]
PLTREDLQPYAALDKNAFCSQVCGLIDRQIVANYKLYPSNYVAFDLQEGTPRFKNFYTPQQKEAFLARLEKLKVAVPGDKAPGVYLGIYANPVKAAMELSAVGC